MVPTDPDNIRIQGAPSGSASETAAYLLRTADSVVLDFDSLLVASRNFHRAFLKRCVQSIGLPVSDSFDEVYAAAAGTSYRTLVDNIWRREISGFGVASRPAFWRVVKESSQNRQCLQPISSSIQPIEDIAALFCLIPTKGIILSGSPPGLVHYILKQCNLMGLLDKYPLFSVFEHKDGKLFASTLYPDVFKYVSKNALVIDDSFHSARAVMSSFRIARGIVRQFDSSKRQTQIETSDATQIIEVDSWKDVLQAEQAYHITRKNQSFARRFPSKQSVKHTEKVTLERQCRHILSYIVPKDESLFVGGSVAVAMWCPHARLPSNDFDFNFFTSKENEALQTPLKFEGLKLITDTRGESARHSDKLSLLADDGTHVDIVFIRRIKMGPWIIESSMDSFLLDCAPLAVKSGSMPRYVPPELVMFEKLLAARGPSEGKHDLFDVTCMLDAFEPRISVLMHIVSTQKSLAADTYKRSKTAGIQKQTAAIAALIERLQTVRSLCNGAIALGSLYTHRLRKMDCVTVHKRIRLLLSALEEQGKQLESINKEEISSDVGNNRRLLGNY